MRFANIAASVLSTRNLLIGAAVAALAGPAMAGTNILPGSGDTVTGSTIHAGFDASIAAGNLIDGTSNAAYGNGDPRWVFADGSNVEETLTVDLGSAKSVDYAGFVYNGQDRIPTSSEILTSTDGVNFTLAAGPLATGAADYGVAGLYDAAWSFAPTSARYVRYDFGLNSIGGFGGGGGAGQGAGIYQLQIQTAAVPEPAAWALMLIGFGGLGSVLRRQHRAAVAA